MTCAQGAGIYSAGTCTAEVYGTCGTILNVFDSEFKNNRAPGGGGGLRLFNSNQDPLTATLRNVIFEANEVYYTMMVTESAIGVSTGHSVYIDNSAGEIVATFDNVKFRKHAGRTYEYCVTMPVLACHERGAGLPAPGEPAILYSTTPGA